MTYFIGSHVFTTRRDARFAIEALLTTDGTLDNDSRAFMMAVLARHPWLGQTSASGFWATVRIEDCAGVKTFVLYTKDGKTRVEFDYRDCLRPPCHHKQVKTAFRTAVQYQADQVKQAFLGSKCPITGVCLDAKNSEVHHEPALSQLISDFLEAKDLREEDIVLTVLGPAAKRARLPDDLRQEWQDYHERNAGLTLISRQAHQDVHGTCSPTEV